MLTVLYFLIVIGVLVVVHEFGHFITAKRAGMKVEEFGFGFPPRLFGWKKGETVYSFNWIPFGGFVKILGEDGDSRNVPGAFTSKPIGRRLIVILAGVVMNFILAAVLLMVVNTIGIRVGLGDIDDEVTANAKDVYVQILSVTPDSPAHKAGLEMFDEIVGFQFGDAVTPVEKAQEVRDIINANAGKELSIVINRGGEVMIKTAQLPETAENGLLGIIPARTGLVSYPWYESLWRGFVDAVNLTIQTAVGYYQLITTLIFEGRLMSEVSGPIGIAQMTGKVAEVGFRFLLQFTALISVNLAILNSIPFPALDGGRALMLVIEKIKGSPVPAKVEGAINSLGFLLLIALMVYATISDIGRLF